MIGAIKGFTSIAVLAAVSRDHQRRSEVAAACGITRDVADTILRRLGARGWIRRTGVGTWATTPRGEDLLALLWSAVQKDSPIVNDLELVAHAT